MVPVMEGVPYSRRLIVSTLQRLYKEGKVDNPRHGVYTIRKNREPDRALNFGQDVSVVPVTVRLGTNIIEAALGRRFWRDLAPPATRVKRQSPC
jgi:hypothetical protein